MGLICESDGLAFVSIAGGAQHWSAHAVETGTCFGTHVWRGLPRRMAGFHVEAGLAVHTSSFSLALSAGSSATESLAAVAGGWGECTGRALFQQRARSMAILGAEDPAQGDTHTHTHMP